MRLNQLKSSCESGPCCNAGCQPIWPAVSYRMGSKWNQENLSSAFGPIPGGMDQEEQPRANRFSDFNDEARGRSGGFRSAQNSQGPQERPAERRMPVALAQPEGTIKSIAGIRAWCQLVVGFSRLENLATSRGEAVRARVIDVKSRDGAAGIDAGSKCDGSVSARARKYIIGIDPAGVMRDYAARRIVSAVWPRERRCSRR